MSDDSIKDPESFFKNYRRMWFGLVVATFILLPIATLAFVGLIPWFSSSAALMAYLGTFVLHLTLFVAGRWSQAEEPEKVSESEVADA